MYHFNRTWFHFTGCNQNNIYVRLSEGEEPADTGILDLPMPEPKQITALYAQRIDHSKNQHLRDVHIILRSRDVL